MGSSLYLGIQLLQLGQRLLIARKSRPIQLMNCVYSLLGSSPSAYLVLEVLVAFRAIRHSHHIRLALFAFDVHEFLQEAHLRRFVLCRDRSGRRHGFCCIGLRTAGSGRWTSKVRSPAYNLDWVGGNHRIAIRVLEICRVRLRVLATHEMHICANHIGPLTAKDMISVGDVWISAVQFHDLYAIIVLIFGRDIVYGFGIASCTFSCRVWPVFVWR